ncbi:hypothetical protein [Aliikangiella sp. G2MR2-5]|uniref:hypothetical protein n=1 Tax=Aliikangiella sp. G2MR2-5 TaxID=2788943 RepID=UPI0018A8C0C7|nr:hypothetical protein [Aliikangiella sp. G2MR2-5]
MRKFLSVTTSVFALLSANSYGAQFKTLAYVGFDSNPHQLSEQHSYSNELFAHTSLQSESNFRDIIYWDVNAIKEVFPDDGRADRFTVDADVKLSLDFELSDIIYHYGIGVEYQQQDKTFVSRETGLVATLDDTSLANRFDYQGQGYYLHLDFASSETFNYRFKLSQSSRDFTDYVVTGVDRLDYDSTTLAVGLDLNTTNQGRFYADVAFDNRVYLDRMDRDEEGEYVIGSQLEFNRVISSLGYVYQPDEDTKWDYVFRYINRYSQGTTFYDTQSASIDIEAFYQVADYHIIEGSLSYRTFYYDEDLNQPYEFFEESEVEQRGFDIFFGYTWVLATMFETNLGFYVNLEAKIFDSPDPLFEYEQRKLSLGLRWSLE